MKAKCIFLILLTSAGLMSPACAQEPVGTPAAKPVGGEVGNTVTGNGGGAKTKKEDPVIPPDPENKIQIVATTRCNTSQTSDCGLTAKWASDIDSDLRRPAGLSSNGIAAVKDLVDAVMKKDERYQKSFGALVHLVRYEDPKVTGDPGVERDVWLACNRGGKDPAKPGQLSCGTDLRLYGRKNVAVLFVHTNVAADSAEAVSSQTAYYGLAKKKLPTPLENLQGLLQISAVLQAATVLKPPVSLLGYGFFHDMPVPSNINVLGARKFGEAKLERLGAKLELLNEGLYFLDFTLGVPLTKLSATEFSAPGQNLQPKTINRQSAYGMASIYFLPVDLSAGTRRYWMPRAVFGVGITGKLGHNYMVGGAMGPPFLQFFVGSEFARKDMLQSNGMVQEQFRSRTVFGLNIPIKSALEKLKTKAAEK